MKIIFKPKEKILAIIEKAASGDSDYQNLVMKIVPKDVRAGFELKDGFLTYQEWWWITNGDSISKKF